MTKVNEAEVCEEKGKIKPLGQTGTRTGEVPLQNDESQS